jgi:hypothetical protein
MERTQRPPMPNSDEHFVIHDRATNARINIREATDQTLAKYHQASAEDLKTLQQSLNQILFQITLCAQQYAVIGYEIDRRKRLNGGALVS